MTALCGARDLTPTGVIDGGWVQVEAGAITAVGPAHSAPPGDTVDLGGAWSLPGDIDLHTHGRGGHDATASPADWRRTWRSTAPTARRGCLSRS